jgi:hypothetical protein
MRGLAAGVAGEAFVKLLAGMLRVHMHFGLKNREVLLTLRDGVPDLYKKVLAPDDCSSKKKIICVNKTGLNKMADY